MIGDYARRDHADAPTTAALLESAREQLDLIAFTLEPFLAEPEIVELLLAKGRGGCAVRLLTSEPGEHLRPLVGHPGFELRAIRGIEHENFQRVDEQMQVEIRIADQPTQPASLLHLRRHGSGGIFDRYAEHFERIWRHWPSRSTVKTISTSGPTPNPATTTMMRSPTGGQTIKPASSRSRRDACNSVGAPARPGVASRWDPVVGGRYVMVSGDSTIRAQRCHLLYGVVVRRGRSAGFTTLRKQKPRDLRGFNTSG